MPSPVLQFKRGAFTNLPGLRAGEPALTTDSFDLYVGIDSTTNNNKFFGSHRYWRKETSTVGSGINLVEGTSNGTSYIQLKSPDSLAGVTTYTFPATPTANYFLKTNSAGDLSWDQVVSNFYIAADSGTPDLVSTGSTITFVGGTNINSTVTDQTITFNLDSDISLTNVNATGIVTAATLAGVTTVDATTKATLEAILGTEPNTFTSLNVIGISTFAGVIDANGGAYIDNIQIGITNDNTIDTVSGNLTLDSAAGKLVVQDHVDIYGDLNVTGNVSVGGTTVTLRGVDVFIENKDIVLGYTTTSSPNDTTANHGGVAIASTEGTPLVNFEVSGINTLPSTYKQLMWFKSGTLGFSTDVFAFNYGVAIGTTTMANGIRLAVGSGITMTDTAISATTVNATNGNFTNLSGSLTGTISTATRAQTVDTVQSSTNATHYLTFVDSDNGSVGAEAVYTDAGITYNPSTNNLTVSGDLAINGGDATTSATTFNLINDTATNVNFGGAATALVMGAATGITTVSNNLTVAGDIRVNGNDIQSSDGNTNITLTSNTLTEVKGDLQVTGNDIKSSTGANAITLSGSDVTVNGNLYVSGSTTQVNTAALTVEDRTIDLGIVNGAAPSANTTWDLGVLFNYYSSGAAKKSAVVWEHGDSRFKFASVLASDTDGSNNDTPQLTVTTFAPIEIGALWVNDCAGTSQVISCTGTTRYLENITIDAGIF